jgi:hypothetical protein
MDDGFSKNIRNFFLVLNSKGFKSKSHPSIITDTHRREFNPAAGVDPFFSVYFSTFIAS